MQFCWDKLSVREICNCPVFSKLLLVTGYLSLYVPFVAVSNFCPIVCTSLGHLWTVQDSPTLELILMGT